MTVATTISNAIKQYYIEAKTSSTEVVAAVAAGWRAPPQRPHARRSMCALPRTGKIG
jgi:hypothetical protein